MTFVAQNLNKVREQIEQACATAGREVSEVTLVAVSKTKPLTAILEAFAAGQLVFGENYVQELEEKVAEIKTVASNNLEKIKFHLIGPLQSNKTDRVVGSVSLIQTVDRIKIADSINKVASKKGIVQDVLLQVNISDEESKSGVRLADLPYLLEHCLDLSALRVQGLMSIGSAFSGAEASVVEREFSMMRELQATMAARFEVLLPQLSMGMSDDFAVAIKHGATIVRVGSKIFGERL